LYSQGVPSEPLQRGLDENLFSEDYAKNLFSEDYDANLFSEDYAKNLFSEEDNGNQPWNRRWAQFMTPNPGPVLEPELKEVNKVENKPVLKTESATKPSDAGFDTMALIKFKGTGDKCPLETDKWEPTLAAKFLGIHSETNHVVCGHLMDPETSYRSLTAQY
jgi:hypothetical protein